MATAQKIMNHCILRRLINGILNIMYSRDKIMLCLMIV